MLVKLQPCGNHRYRETGMTLDQFLTCECDVQDHGSSRAVQTAAFQLLLTTGWPVSQSLVIENAGMDRGTGRAVLDDLERRGQLARDATGRIIGCAGLSVAATQHELWIGAERRWAWCAIDAVGIVAALQTDARIISQDPQTGRPVEIVFQDGQSQSLDAVLFIADPSSVHSAVQDWCPSVNFFETSEAATAWAGEHGVSGSTISLPGTVDLVGDRWNKCLPTG